MKYSVIDRDSIIGFWAIIATFLGISVTFTGSMEIFTQKAAFWGSFVMIMLEVIGAIGTSLILSTLLLRKLLTKRRIPLLWILSAVSSAIMNTLLLLLFEYYLSPKPHTPIWDRIERYPLALIIMAAFVMIPLVVTVSYSTIHVVSFIYRKRHRASDEIFNGEE
ncbi:MAG: hypothetical protein GY801_40890 [bacterium]|nr:hypothetical protein [bacterium]